MMKIAAFLSMLLLLLGFSSVEAQDCISDWTALQATVNANNVDLLPGLVYTLCPSTVFRESGQINFQVDATVKCGSHGLGEGCVIEPAVLDDSNRRSSFFSVSSGYHKAQPSVTFIGLTMRKYYGNARSSAVTVAGYDANPDFRIDEYEGGATFVDCKFQNDGGPYSTGVRGLCAPNLVFLGCTFTGQMYLGIYTGDYDYTVCGRYGSLTVENSIFEGNKYSIFFSGNGALSINNSCFLGNYGRFEDIILRGSPTVSGYENFSDGSGILGNGRLMFQSLACGPRAPSSIPSVVPTASFAPSSGPSFDPSALPSASSAPSSGPSFVLSDAPTNQPSGTPSSSPSLSQTPSSWPSITPSNSPVPSFEPSTEPTSVPSDQPSRIPSLRPSVQPTVMPSGPPSLLPSFIPSSDPSEPPSYTPSSGPSASSSSNPSFGPTTFGGNKSPSVVLTGPTSSCENPAARGLLASSFNIVAAALILVLMGA